MFLAQLQLFTEYNRLNYYFLFRFVWRFSFSYIYDTDKLKSKSAVIQVLIQYDFQRNNFCFSSMNNFKSKYCTVVVKSTIIDCLFCSGTTKKSMPKWWWWLDHFFLIWNFLDPVGQMFYAKHNFFRFQE